MKLKLSNMSDRTFFLIIGIIYIILFAVMYFNTNSHIDKLRIPNKPDSSNVVVQSIGELTITYYTDNPKENMNVIPVKTANGSVPFVGGCAISRDLLKKCDIHFGDIVYVQDKGFYIINDLMAGNKSNHLDIFTFNKKQANINGKCKVKCVLIKRKKGQ
jgi:3D (Asp-Asp-Asp) domain-containing protein